MKYFDSHAHYFDSWFNEYEGGADALVEKILADKVGAIVNVSTNPENLKECLAQAKKFDNMYASAGIHPEDCLYIDDIDAALAEIEASVCDEHSRKKNKIVAIGEIGFDYHIARFERGEALVCSGNNKVPVVIKASKSEQEMITTDRAELQRILAERRNKTVLKEEQ